MLSMKPEAAWTPGGRLAAPHRLGPALEHHHVAAFREMAVHGPLDVLGSTEITFRGLGHTGDLEQFGVADRRALLPRSGHVTPLHAVSVRTHHQLGVLGRDRAGVDLEDHLVHQEVVRRDLTRHDRLAESPRGLDGDLGPVTGGRIEREGHPGRLGIDHLLHSHRHRHHLVIVSHLVAVGHGPVGEERGPAPLDMFDDGVGAPDPQERVLLAGEAGVGQVLGGGTRPDRNGHVVLVATRAQLRISGANGVVHIRGHR